MRSVWRMAGRMQTEAVNSQNTTPFLFGAVFFATTLCFQVTSAFGKGPKTVAAATTGLRQRLQMPELQISLTERRFSMFSILEDGKAM